MDNEHLSNLSEPEGDAFYSGMLGAGGKMLVLEDGIDKGVVDRDGRYTEFQSAPYNCRLSDSIVEIHVMHRYGL
jgi:hypothetical protein